MTKLTLTDKIVRDLAAPKTGMTIIRDSKVRGLGVRILPSGTRAFILDYTFAGQRRIFTLGKAPQNGTTPDLTVAGARDRAQELKVGIKCRNSDPASEAAAAREAPTVRDLSEKFAEAHFPKLRETTRGDYERMLENDVLPALANKKVASIKFDDIAKLHRAITGRGSPTSANFCIALCSKMFNFGIQLGMLDKNPAKGVERNRAQPRNRYLSMDEISSLTKALASHGDQEAADIFRLLLLTGARRGETQAATWEQFNLKEGIWVKPSHATKQNREHRVPLAAPARALLAARRAKADAHLKELAREAAQAPASERKALEEWRKRVDTFVFPARESASGHRVEVQKNWLAVCKAAGIVTKEGHSKKERHSARIHDLRHTAASLMASSGSSLPIIGQLLGHTQASTTHRYAHLFDTAQRGAVERLGAIIEGGPSAEVIQMRGKKRIR